MIERNCLCCLPYTKEEEAKLDAEFARVYPKAKAESQNDHGHDLANDCKALNVPPLGSVEDRHNHFDFRT